MGDVLILAEDVKCGPLESRATESTEPPSYLFLLIHSSLSREAGLRAEYQSGVPVLCWKDGATGGPGPPGL